MEIKKFFSLIKSIACHQPRFKTCFRPEPVPLPAYVYISVPGTEQVRTGGLGSCLCVSTEKPYLSSWGTYCFIKNFHALALGDMPIFLKAVREHRDMAMFMLMLGSGLRVEKVANLRISGVRH